MEIIILTVFIMIAIPFMLWRIRAAEHYLNALSALVERTFREYYKGQDIEVKIISGGLELVWKDGMKGFITLYCEGGDIVSPIKDLNEADALAAKVSHVVYDYIKDRDSKV